MCTRLWSQAVLALMRIMQHGPQNMVYGLWNLEYNMENGMWNVEHGIFNMEHGVRTVESGEHGVCSMKHGVPIKEYGMEYRGRRMKHGVQSLALEYGGRHGGMENGVWNMGCGTWNIEY